MVQDFTASRKLVMNTDPVGSKSLFGFSMEALGEDQEILLEMSKTLLRHTHTFQAL